MILNRRVTVPSTRHLRLRMAAARGALAWERLWPKLWPPLGVATLFLALALSDLLPALPGLLHALILVGLALAFLWFTFAALWTFRWPSGEEARRRLELKSALSHRPLQTLADRLPAGIVDAGAIQLWRLHQHRAAEQIRRLRIGRPRAGLAGVDPLAVRVPLILALGVAAISAAGDPAARLERALWPQLTLFGPTVPPTLVLWVTPPLYTGQPPIALDPHAIPADPVAIPAHAKLLAQVEGGGKPPVLEIAGSAQPFVETAERIYKLEAELVRGDRLTVRQGRTVLGEWPVRLIPDRVPEIAFTEDPEATRRGTLKLSYRVADDYGVTAASLQIRRADGLPTPDGKETVEVALPLPNVNTRSAEQVTYQDLTPHPWAGLPVKMRLSARDGAGQIGTSAWIETVLPERQFHNPVAQAIIAQRKQLVLKPAQRLPVVRALGNINANHELFRSNPVIILALRSAQQRLIDDSSAKAAKEVVDLLWDSALALEEGEAAIAERELRAAEQALQDALANNAPDKEIERLMDELERALDRYLQALAEQLERQRAQGNQPRMANPDARMVSPNELKDMLNQARELARSGARDAARQLLSQLQEMLENLQAAMMDQMPQGADQAMQMMSELNDMTKLQQQLLDRSFRRSQGSDQDQGEGSMTDRQLDQENSADAAAQEALRKRLGDLMRQLGDLSGNIPRPMGEAERAMKGAVGALGQGQPGAAAEAQGNALDALQRSARAMAEQFQRQFGRLPGRGEQSLDRFGNRRDPFGRTRPQGQFEDTGDVAIPDKSDLQRAREILDELRRRAGERTRPALERDYIDRLLKRF